MYNSFACMNNRFISGVLGTCIGKPDSAEHLCVDYSALNTKVRRDYMLT